MLSMQRLDSRPIVLLCNGVNSEQQSTLSIKAAERAIGRAFEFVLPEDIRLMISAANQGQEISAVKRGTKLERTLNLVADAVAAGAFADATQSSRR
jgi:Flp pilus assembly CpaE family ATPase